MNLWARANDIAKSGKTVAIVQVTKVQGSAPRETGALMLVTADGILGSIGGGTLEWRALAAAQRLLPNGPSRQSASYALGPELGQCCGGRVEILTEIFDATNAHHLENVGLQERRTLYVFGAGHVGKSLVVTLAQTEFDVIWCDPRPGVFPSHTPGNTGLRADQDCPGILQDAPPGSLVFVMSHSHALDLAIVDAALRNPNVSATGLIGSATKRARFETRLLAAGVDSKKIADLICPIGVADIESKKPEAIAIATAAQILVLDERLSPNQVQDAEALSCHQTPARKAMS